MTDSTGNPTAKLQTKTKGKQEVMKANVTTADVELMRKLMPGAAPEFEKWLQEQGNKVTDISSDLKGKDKKKDDKAKEEGKSDTAAANSTATAANPTATGANAAATATAANAVATPANAVAPA